MPNGGAGFSVVGNDVDRTIAGVHYQRSAWINKDELSAEASVRSLLGEFPASEAAGAQKALRDLSDDLLYAKLPTGPVPVSVSGIGPAIRSLGGVTLGMTPSQLMHAKGAPVKKWDPNHWVYNSIDAAHDGLLDVYFSDNPVEESRDVRAVVFAGRPEAVPRGLANLLGHKRQYLVRQFGEPVSETSAGPDGQYLYFGNGVCALLHSGTTISYGVSAVTK